MPAGGRFRHPAADAGRTGAEDRRRRASRPPFGVCIRDAATRAD